MASVLSIIPANRMTGRPSVAHQFVERKVGLAVPSEIM